MENFEETKRLLNSSVLYYIITCDMSGRYSYVNENYARQFAHAGTKLVGQPYHVTMHPDDMGTCEAVSARCFAEPGRLFPATIRKHDGHGGYVYTQWEYRAMVDGQGKPAGIFCLGYNITGYVAEQRQLQDTRVELQKSSALLEKLVFQQAHLVRAPLSNIMGLAEILDRSALESGAAGICAMISESARQLDAVIREIVGAASK